MGFMKGALGVVMFTGTTLLGCAASGAGEQVEPLAGGWKTWVLTSGSQLRLPAPPDQAATAAELQELRALVTRRDAAALDRIGFWDAGPQATAGMASWRMNCPGTTSPARPRLAQ